MLIQSLMAKIDSQMQTLKGDLVGGITAALLSFPRAMALGVLVFSPLGPEFIPLGIAAGMMSLFIANVTAAPVGALHIMNNAPCPLSSFMLLGATTLIVDRLGNSLSGSELAITTMGLVFLTVAASGMIQTLFGLLRLGGIAKYIPYPVMAGLLNGSAILIMSSQINIMLGLPSGVTLSDLTSQFPLIQPLTLLVGFITCLATWASPKMAKQIPAPLIGILIGSGAYLVLSSVGLSAELGAVIGSIPSALPFPQYIDDFYTLMTNAQIHALIIDLIPFALGIAAIDSLRSLVVCSVGESIIMQRVNSNRELVAQGLGNTLNGVFGGISTAGSLSSTLANHQYGGRTALSRFFSGLFPLLVMLLLSPLVAKIPTVVLAGLLIMIALESLNKWSLSLPKQLKSSLKRHDFEPLMDLLLVIAVTVFMITFGIIVALSVGLFISIVWFVVRMSKSGMYRATQGNLRRSNTTRNQTELDCLSQEGHRIQILELEGPLFFGTADKLAARIDTLLKGDVRFIILDFSRITSVDTTGEQILQQSITKCLSNKVSLYFSAINMEKSDAANKELIVTIRQCAADDNYFTFLEIAMAVSEDRLLDQFIGDNRYYKEIPLSEVTTLQLLNEEELNIAKKYLSRQDYHPKSMIFIKNSRSSTVYFLVKGRARITQPGWDSEHERLATLGPGSTFGEMSLLDGLPRSADVQTGQIKVTCYLLNLDDLSRLTAEHPKISHKLVLGLGMELSKRLRVKNISAQS